MSLRCHLCRWNSRLMSNVLRKTSRMPVRTTWFVEESSLSFISTVTFLAMFLEIDSSYVMVVWLFFMPWWQRNFFFTNNLKLYTKITWAGELNVTYWSSFCTGNYFVIYFVVQGKCSIMVFWCILIWLPFK